MRYALIGLMLMGILLGWLIAQGYGFLMPLVLSIYLIYVFLAWALESKRD